MNVLKEAILLKEQGYFVYMLHEISHAHFCGEHEYDVDHAQYREVMNQIKSVDTCAEFVMDTLRYRKKLVLADGELLRKASLFEFKKQVLDGKRFICVGDGKQLETMRELFAYFYIEAMYLPMQKEAVSNLEYSPDLEILFYSQADEILTNMLVRKGFVWKENIKIFLLYTMLEVYKRKIVLDMDLGY